jgi:hypothetical protein
MAVSPVETAIRAIKMSTGGEVANALVCKTSIRGFNSLPVLHILARFRRKAFSSRKTESRKRSPITAAINCLFP